MHSFWNGILDTLELTSSLSIMTMWRALDWMTCTPTSGLNYILISTLIICNCSDVPACIPVDIYVETGGNATAPPPPIEETSPALRLKLNWSVEIISWSPQQSTRLAILPNGKVVVALPHKHVVLLFNKEGKAKGHLGTFENPHGVSALEGGKVAVLDDERIVVFSKSGEEHKFVPQGLNTATGLCVDEEGALVTINRYRSDFFLVESLKLKIGYFRYSEIH